jgi:hypothetical protein
MNINRSLLTLGRVIKTLREQSDSKKPLQNVRIPYRYVILNVQYLLNNLLNTVPLTV